MSAGPSSEYHSAELSLPWKPHRGSYVLAMRPCNESQSLGYLVNFSPALPLRFLFPLRLPQHTSLWSCVHWTDQCLASELSIGRVGLGGAAEDQETLKGLVFFHSLCSGSQKSRMDALSWVGAVMPTWESRSHTQITRVSADIFGRDLKEGCGN